jgi:secreted trypsin-like serine protease
LFTYQGGPLFVLGEIGGKKKYILVGIVSYGYKCGFQNMPGVYTRVSAYLEWIKANSSQKSSQQIKLVLVILVLALYINL